MRAAAVLFSRKGFEDTSVEEICLAAGYSKGGFYFHFRGKDDLLAQMLESDMKIAGAGCPDTLTAELWAAAARNEGLRRRLAARYESRRRDLLPAPVRVASGTTASRRLADLLLALDAGLRVQGLLSMSSSGEVQDFINSLLGRQTTSEVEPRARRTRAAS
jgi:AcrR family transcriptional regulator